MRLYARAHVWWVRFRVPGGKILRRTTGQRDRAAAESIARAMVEREARRWCAQAELFSSTDAYTLERCLADHGAARAREGWALATLAIDSQNTRYLLARLPGETPIRELTGAQLSALVEGWLAAGLTPHTIDVRPLHTSPRDERQSDR